MSPPAVLSTMLAPVSIPSILSLLSLLSFFFFNHTATTEIYTLSLHDALPIYTPSRPIDQLTAKVMKNQRVLIVWDASLSRSEEHTSELQSLRHLVCRLLLEKKKKKQKKTTANNNKKKRSHIE